MAGFAFRDAFAHGGRLDDAAEAALAADAGADLAALIRELLDDEVLVDEEVLVRPPRP